MDPQHYCLRWKYHHSNLQAMFYHLLESNYFCDVTLACEGRTIRAHRVVLCASSSYFTDLLTSYKEKDPIIIMREVKYEDVKSLVEFMYKGEINVAYTALPSLLKTAEELCIKGLADVSPRQDYGGPFKPEENNESAGEIDDFVDVENNEINSNPNYGEAKAVSINEYDNAKSLQLVPKDNNMNNYYSSNSESSRLGSNNVPTDSLCYIGDNKNSKQTISSISSALNDGTGSDENEIPYSFCEELSRADVKYNNLKRLSHSVSSNDVDVPQLAPSMSKTVNYTSTKRKRGRPPLDEDSSTNELGNRLPALQRNVFSPLDASSPLLAGALEKSDTFPTKRNSSSRQMSSSDGSTGAVPRLVPNYNRFLTSMGSGVVASPSNPSSEQELNSPSSMPSGPVAQTNYDNYGERPPGSPGESIFMTPSEHKQWMDVVKMNDYLTKGRRPQFWEEPFTKRVMNGIRNKTLEMKKAAKILGVSYGTLYGRYRDTYGCLKHPYRGSIELRGRDRWSSTESGLTMSELQQEVFNPPHALETFNVGPSTLGTYVDQKHPSRHLFGDNRLETQYEVKDENRINRLDTLPQFPLMTHLFVPQQTPQKPNHPEVQITRTHYAKGNQNASNVDAGDDDGTSNDPSTSELQVI